MSGVSFCGSLPVNCLNKVTSELFFIKFVSDGQLHFTTIFFQCTKQFSCKTRLRPLLVSKIEAKSFQAIPLCQQRNQGQIILDGLDDEVVYHL